MIPFEDKESIIVKAVYLGEKFELKSFETADLISHSPITMKAGVEGIVVLLPYGAAILFNLTGAEEKFLIEGLSNFVQNALKTPEYEQHRVKRINEAPHEGVISDGIVVKQFSLDRLQLIAIVMAESVALAYYESTMATVVDQVEPVAEAMKKHGKLAPGRQASKTLLRHIGDALLIQNRMLGRLQLQEKPALLWDKPELERMYQRLLDEYEIRDRYVAMVGKQALVERTAEIVLDMLRFKSIHRVDWYITILIVLSILIGLYRMD